MLNGHSIMKAADWCIKLPLLRQRNIEINCQFVFLIHVQTAVHVYMQVQITECMKCGVKMLSVWCIDAYKTHMHTQSHTPLMFVLLPYSNFIISVSRLILVPTLPPSLLPLLFPCLKHPRN